MTRRKKLLAYRDARGRPHIASTGAFTTEDAYRELKARESDKEFQRAAAKAASTDRARRTSRKRQVAASKAAQKNRKRRLRRAKVRIPSTEEREKQLQRGRFTGQLHGSTPTYNTTVYLFIGVESFPLVRDFIREVLLKERPPPLVRVTIRAGDGRQTESMGTLWNSPRASLRDMAVLEYSESAKRLFEMADELDLPIYIEVEVKRLKGGKGKQRKASVKKTRERKRGPAKRKTGKRPAANRNVSRAGGVRKNPKKGKGVRAK